MTPFFSETSNNYLLVVNDSCVIFIFQKKIMIQLISTIILWEQIFLCCRKNINKCSSCVCLSACLPATSLKSTKTSWDFFARRYFHKWFFFYILLKDFLDFIQVVNVCFLHPRRVVEYVDCIICKGWESLNHANILGFPDSLSPLVPIFNRCNVYTELMYVSLCLTGLYWYVHVLESMIEHLLSVCSYFFCKVQPIFFV